MKRQNTIKALAAAFARARLAITANIWSRHEMKIRDVVKEKLLMLFGGLVLFARDVSRNRANENQEKVVPPHFAWPHVMNSFATMRGPIAWRTWIWNRQHARWHHGYYRTHR